MDNSINIRLRWQRIESLINAALSDASYKLNVPVNFSLRVQPLAADAAVIYAEPISKAAWSPSISFSAVWPFGKREQEIVEQIMRDFGFALYKAEQAHKNEEIQEVGPLPFDPVDYEAEQRAFDIDTTIEPGPPYIKFNIPFYSFRHTETSGIAELSDPVRSDGDSREFCEVESPRKMTVIYMPSSFHITPDAPNGMFTIYCTHEYAYEFLISHSDVMAVTRHQGAMYQDNYNVYFFPLVGDRHSDNLDIAARDAMSSVVQKLAALCDIEAFLQECLSIDNSNNKE